MSNVFGSFDQVDPAHMKVSAIEADKKRSEQFLAWKNLNIPTSLLLKHILCKKLLDKANFLTTAARKKPVLEKSLRETLLFIKKLFETLYKENKSSDYLFAQNLSTHWHLLLEAKEEMTTSHSLEAFIKKIHSYPPNVDHSLGYYLTEFTGEKWLPFPFMDILSSLHEDALLHKSKSHLATWIHAIDSLL